MANLFDMASHWTTAYKTAPVNPRQFIDLILLRCVQFGQPSVNNTAQAQNVYYANQLQGPQGVATGKRHRPRKCWVSLIQEWGRKTHVDGNRVPRVSVPELHLGDKPAASLSKQPGGVAPFKISM
jgi:hypothetical protein